MRLCRMAPRIAFAVVLVTSAAWLATHGAALEPAGLAGRLHALGAWGPILFLGAYVLGSVLLFPAALLSLAGGAAFGPVWGTLLDLLGATLGAGAAFLVAPGYDRDVAAAAREAGVPYIPGALTPTEVQRCLADGAELVKLFPAGALGAAYVRDLLGPFPALRLMPTGGVSAENAAAFLEAGAAAVAVGSSLVNARSTYESVRSQASHLTSAIRATDKGDARDAA